MFLSTSINVLFTHDPTSYVAFFTPSCLNKGFVVVVVVRYVTETVIRSVQRLQLNKLPYWDEGARKNGRLRGAVSLRG